MNLTAFLKIEEIPGESQRAGHEDEIDVFGVAWGVERNVSSQIGRGRARARSDVAPLEFEKFLDASSPYLADACARGKSFKKATLSVRKDSGEAHLDYLVITMENVVVVSYEFASGETDDPDDRLSEAVALDFGKATIKYTRMADDHSAGDEHEVEIRG